jgi:uncharacterized repeat protein (TIGR01451 family)
MSGPEFLDELDVRGPSCGRRVGHRRKNLRALVLFQRRTLPVLVFLIGFHSHYMLAQDASGNDEAKAAASANPQTNNETSTPQAPPKIIHIAPFGPPDQEQKLQGTASQTSSNNGFAVQYFGGPVISNVQVIKVLWGSSVDSASTSGLGQFYTDVTQSDYFSLLEEYGTVGLNGIGAGSPPGSNQTIGPGTFGGEVTISPSLCSGGATNPACTITDAQIRTEITNQLNAGHLPAPVRDPGSGNFNTIYMIYFPPNVTITLVPGANSCQRGGFCAYHSFVAGGPQQVPYGVFPDFSQGGCAPSNGCGFGTSFQNLSSASSHELAEAVTDADVAANSAFAPPIAWADQNTGAEIGDFCNQNTAQITVNGNTYTVQRLASNMQSLNPFPARPACVSSPAHFQMQVSPNAVPGSPLQVTVTPQSSLGNAMLGNYNNTVHFTSTDGSAVLPADYTFVPGTDNGSHTFTVKLNSIGVQTFTVTDTQVTKMTAQATIDVEHNPDLTVTSEHSGSFTQGQVGATYTIKVANIGDLPTSGSTVTVVDTLPFAFTATAMSGSGWSCTFSTGTCTTTAVVAAGASYPPITLTVNVASFAPSPENNVVNVSGGGEVNTTNDSFTDPTVVIQLPDLFIMKTHVGPFAQGQIGATYSLTVSNVGFAPTSGTVTVTDTLPSGLTATAIAGAGWSCSTPPTLTCTRSDVLSNGGSSYPPIKLTVNVDPAAPMPSITNSATVSGGGEANTSNDVANDPTGITVAASDLVVASTHNGDFKQGQTGATYLLTVSNIGPKATDGSTVTVSETLPPFPFTITGMSGPGWTCNPGGFPQTCTRSDVLAGNTTGTISSYPPITLTVNVSISAPPQATNSVSVSGGGEINTANDTGIDPTNIIQLPDLTVFQSHGTLAQGLVGATYTIQVNNIASGATSGTITVTDKLSPELTATAITGSGWNCTLSTLTCTRDDSIPGNTLAQPISITVNVSSTATTASSTVTVSGGGEVNTNNNQSTDTSPVSPPVKLQALTGNSTVIAGSPAAFVIEVLAPVPGTVSFACSSGVPPGAACTFLPTTVSGPIVSILGVTVSTTSPAGLAGSMHARRSSPLYPALLPAFAIAAIIGLRRQGRRRRWLLSGFFIAVLGLTFSGCGGGGSSSPPPRTVTPPGTYTITVTGTNTTTNFQSSTTLTLNVR